jgi:ATP-dependent Clp protease protease subunit
MSVPYVIEKGEGNQEKMYDIYSRMLKDRIIFIKGEFTSELSDAVTAQLLFLESTDKDKDIYMYINSPGGRITAMFSIYDTMQYIKPDICTLAYGEASSAGSFILAGGTPGKRFALPNSQIMLHELSGGHQGKFHDMKNSFEHTEKLYDKMANYYVKFTGQKLDTIKDDMKRDFYMTPEEAMDYGVIDAVQERR